MKDKEAHYICWVLRIKTIIIISWKRGLSITSISVPFWSSVQMKKKKQKTTELSFHIRSMSKCKYIQLIVRFHLQLKTLLWRCGVVALLMIPHIFPFFLHVFSLTPLRFVAKLLFIFEYYSVYVNAHCSAFYFTFDWILIVVCSMQYAQCTIFSF